MGAFQKRFSKRFITYLQRYICLGSRAGVILKISHVWDYFGKVLAFLFLRFVFQNSSTRVVFRCDVLVLRLICVLIAFGMTSRAIYML